MVFALQAFNLAPSDISRINLNWKISMLYYTRSHDTRQYITDDWSITILWILLEELQHAYTRYVACVLLLEKYARGETYNL